MNLQQLYLCFAGLSFIIQSFTLVLTFWIQSLSSLTVIHQVGQVQAQCFGFVPTCVSVSVCVCVCVLRYSWCIILYVSGVQHSDSQFLKIVLHLQLLQNNGYIPYAVQYILLAYFIHSTLYLLILYLYLAPSPLSLLTGNHQFSISLSLFLFLLYLLILVFRFTYN